MSLKTRPKKGLQSQVLWILLLALQLGACSTLRTRSSTARDSGGDRSWLRRREPRVTEVSRDPANQRFERVRLERWRRVARDIGLSWPVRTPRITSRFGTRSGEPHDGVDLRAAVGTPVHASHDGRVLYSGTGISGYGRLVVIRHPSGIATVYAHNSRLRVRKGQQVRRGQLIANAGASGRASGPHVHFEVRAGSRPLNPIELINDRSSRRGTLAALD